MWEVWEVEKGSEVVEEVRLGSGVWKKFQWWRRRSWEWRRCAGGGQTLGTRMVARSYTQFQLLITISSGISCSAATPHSEREAVIPRDTPPSRRGGG